MDRRTFLQAAAAGAVATSAVSALLANSAPALSVRNDRTRAPLRVYNDVLLQTYPFTRAALGYETAAVEPAVDALTMSIHHDKHHAAYVDNLNEALEEQPALHGKTLQELLTSLNDLPDEVRDAVRNNGGGHANHAMLWRLLAPGGANAPTGALLAAITRDYGSVQHCLAELKTAGAEQFGSGWTWLVRDESRTLRVRSTANQDTPISDGDHALLGVDVWEHAYYLKYQNRREEYLDAVLAALNWDVVATAYSA